VEVNGENVLDKSNAEIFGRITASSVEHEGHLSLLVVDANTEQYYRRRDVTIDAQMTQLLRVTCPDVNPAALAPAVAMETDSDTNGALADLPAGQNREIPHFLSWVFSNFAIELKDLLFSFYVYLMCS